MPDKIVNHFVLADGSVARYDYDGLLNAPTLFIKDIVTEVIGCMTDGNVYQAERYQGMSSAYITINTPITIPKGYYLCVVSPIDVGFSLVDNHSYPTVYRAWSKEPYLASEQLTCLVQMRTEDRQPISDSDMANTYVIVTPSINNYAEIASTVDEITNSYDLVDGDGTEVIDYFVDLKNSKINRVSSENCKTLCVECVGGKTYTVNKTADTVFRVGYAKTKDITLDTPLYGIIQNSNGNSITITTGADALMLCIYYYNDTKSVLDESTLLNSISIITKTAIDYTARGIAQTALDIANTVETAPSLFKVFSLPTVPAQNGTDPSQLINLQSATVASIYSLLQSIIDNSGGYIQKEVCGNDASNTYEVWKLTLKNDPTTPAPRKVLIDANVHCGEGDAIDACFTCIWLCKFLSEECRTNEIARYIRNNYDFEIIPLANPWGLDNNSYGNANGVNINRNYDYNFVPNMSFNYNTTSGASAFSEPETQYIRDMLLDNLDAYFWMDLHSYGGGATGKKAFYVQAGDTLHPYNAERAKRVFSHTKNMIDDVVVEWYDSFDQNGWGPAYGAKTLGIWSPNLECGCALAGSNVVFSSGALTSDFYDLVGFLMFS